MAMVRRGRPRLPREVRVRFWEGMREGLALPAAAQAAGTGHESAGGLLVPSERMLKAWNRSAGRPLHGFHMEVLAWKVFDPGWRAAWFGPGLGMGSDAENLSRFFAEAPSRLRRRLPDPARGEGDVGAYLGDRARESDISKLETAGSRCQRAAKLLADGDTAGAGALYRTVFGDAFPR